MSAADWWRTGYASDFARDIGRIADALEKLVEILAKALDEPKDDKGGDAH